MSGSRAASGAIAAAGVALFGYAAVRAATLGFTHDESFTYLHFVRQPLAAILTWQGPEPTNDHLLNTVLVKLAEAVAGPRELVLRLPNVAALAAYLVAAAGLASRTPRGAPAVAVFVLLTANPYLLEFFALARGYGLGLGLMLLSLHVLVCWIAQGRPGDVGEWAALVLGSLAVLAQPIFLGYYAGLMAVVALFRRRGGGRAWGSVPAWVTGLIVLALVVRPLPDVLRRTSGIRSFGGRSGFWPDTVVSLAESSLQGTGGALAAGLLSAAAGILAAAATLHVARRLRRDGWAATLAHPAPLALALAALWAAQCVALKHLAGVPYLRDRAALPFYPLAVLSVAALLDAAGPRLRAVAAGIAIAAAAAHFAHTANLTHTRDWRYDADTRAMVDDVATLRGGRQAPMRLGLTWLLEPTVNFYRVTRGLEWLAPATRQGLVPSADAYLALPMDEASLTALPVDVVRRYPVSGGVLGIRRP